MVTRCRGWSVFDTFLTPPGEDAPRERKEDMKEDLKKVKFNSDTNEFYGNYGDGMVPISQEECYRFINSFGVKCLDDQDGYAIYGYR